ncbi:hypothetical protein [Candidatus Poriferisocius sp.]|uniref:hypothetical protein n=1 Tax=Candidatus Poriferisocius sp. TaxID=3101276 RepID=UPI003B02EC40
MGYHLRRSAVVIAVTLIAVACGSDNSEPTTAKELFEGCVSAWDGNHEGLEARIRARLNDPGSMETHGTYYNSSDSIADGEIRIRLNYSAANAFGGKVRTDAWATMGLDCEIITVTDFGF